MSLRDLLRNSWTILRRSRLIWVFSAVYTLFTLIDLVISQIYQPSSFESGSSCLKVYFYSILLFAESGMVYAANQEISGQPASFKEAWGLFRNVIGSLIIVYIIFILAAVLLFILLFILFAIFAYFLFRQLDSSEWQAIIYLAVTIIAFLGVPFLEFAYRAVLLDQKWGFSGLVFGTRVLLRKYWQAFFVLAGGSFLLTLVECVISIAYLAFQDPVVLHDLGQNAFFQRWIILSSTPAFRLVSLSFGLVSGPFLSAMITLMYLDSARKINPPIDTPTPSPLPTTP